MKQLTKAEEEVMQILWQLEQANVAAIVKEYPNPKPAYNTVSTIVRILEQKGVVSHTKKGKGYIYYPVLAKEAYSNQSLNKLVEGYFQGSFSSMVSFFMKKNDISTQELEEILDQINKGDKL